MPGRTRYASMLTPQQFDGAAAQHPRMAPANLAAARLVLVDGCTLEGAAQASGCSRQRVQRLCALLASGVYPHGWVTRVVTLPPDLMAHVDELQAQAGEDLRECGAAMRRGRAP